jgi:Kef-type K+ transport system membrane component KefB
MGAAMSITAFPVLARMLAEHRMVGTRVGALALASAAVDDVLAWCLLALVAAIVSATGGSGDLVQILVLSTLYVTALVLIVRPLPAYLVRRWVRDRVPPLFIVVLVAGDLPVLLRDDLDRNPRDIRRFRIWFRDAARAVRGAERRR